MNIDSRVVSLLGLLLWSMNAWGASEAFRAISVKADPKQVSLGAEFTLSVDVSGLKPKDNESLLKGLELVFPGFRQSSPPAFADDKTIQVKGSIGNPGCHAFQVTVGIEKQQHIAMGYVLCVWHYPHHGVAYKHHRLHQWYPHFSKDRLIFMPNGFDYNYPKTADARIQRHMDNDKIISVADALGIKDHIYYMHMQVDPETDRLRDLLMAKYPTTYFVRNVNKKVQVAKELFTKYFDTRRQLLE